MVSARQTDLFRSDWVALEPLPGISLQEDLTFIPSHLRQLFLKGTDLILKSPPKEFHQQA